jgi:hypothetical protein
MKKPSVKKSSSECASCAEWERRALDAEKERNEAVMALARERELTNALRLSVNAALVHAEPSNEGLPLRYALVDRANDEIKKVLGPAHVAVRSVAKSVIDVVSRKKP